MPRKKILYLSDNYAAGVQGTKKSLYDELIARDFEAVWIDKKCMKNFGNYLNVHQPDLIFLAHTGLKVPEKFRKGLKVPVISFSFSDPYFTSPKPKLSTVYVTNHKKTYDKYKDIIQCVYFPTACDVSFHKPIDMIKIYDITIIGLAKHPRFKNKNIRIEFSEKLRKTFPDYNIHCFGRGWPEHPKNHSSIQGSEFLRVISQSRIGLDIQDDWSPLAHRMLEYGACGTAVITRDRPEVFEIFSDGILTYTNYNTLCRQIKFLMRNNNYKEWGYRLRNECISKNNINHRVDHLLSELKRFNLL